MSGDARIDPKGLYWIRDWEDSNLRSVRIPRDTVLLHVQCESKTLEIVPGVSKASLWLSISFLIDAFSWTLTE